MTDLERDLVLAIGDWDAFWREAESMEGGILAHRYTRAGEIRATYAEIAEGLGLNKERVRQRLAKAIRKLRHPSYSRMYGARGLTAEERLG